VCGSALKICYVAAGLVDVYPRLNGTKEWDTAAADIILRESGGEILACDSKAPLLYNKESVKNPYFIAFGKTQIGEQIYRDLLQGSALVFA
ncbi:MAG: 3'(2'),5'-bisphosphate nucleotidase CysQ, partial [Helicobacter sp.]|nr:3'(2'),5'-bisphosphate nucleotidase CysQ [Helicobacter sp.]